MKIKWLFPREIEPFFYGPRAVFLLSLSSVFTLPLNFPIISQIIMLKFFFN